jgi:hypothetical protein
MGCRRFCSGLRIGKGAACLPAVGRLRPLLTTPLILPPSRRPSPRTSPVHTQPFAFRPPKEDDESVKISNTTSGRPGTLSPVLPANHSSAARLQNHQFLFDTNEPFLLTANFSTHRKQSTSIFLFDTNERSHIIAHQSRITDQVSLFAEIRFIGRTESHRAASPLRRGLVAVMLRRDFRGVTCN